MAGTITGAKKAAKTNKEKYGADYYRHLGHLGGSAITDKPRGFAANPELAKRAGRIGGKRSKRGKAKKNPEE